MNDEVIYLESAGIHRRFVLHRPGGVRDDVARPAVLMLDGRGGTPWTAMKSTGWSARSDRDGFLVAYPEALRLDPLGPQHFLSNPQMWNAGAGGTDTERADVDDVRFLEDVIDDLVAWRGADPRRIFMTGFSNGAAMTFRVAAECPERLAGIAPVSGPCRVRDVALRPVPTLYLYGRLDPLSPFDGGPVDLPWGGTEYRAPVREHVRRWVRAQGSAEVPVIREADGVTIERYGPAFEFRVVHDLGHVWPGGHRLLPEKIVGASSARLSATDEIWAFFSKLSR